MYILYAGLYVDYSIENSLPSLVPCCKINEHILDVSLNMCPIMHPPLVMATICSSCPLSGV